MLFTTTRQTMKEADGADDAWSRDGGDHADKVGKGENGRTQRQSPNRTRRRIPRETKATVAPVTSRLYFVRVWEPLARAVSLLFCYLKLWCFSVSRYTLPLGSLSRCANNVLIHLILSDAQSHSCEYRIFSGENEGAPPCRSWGRDKIDPLG